MKRKTLKGMPAWIALAAALAVLPCGSASAYQAQQGEPDWPACSRLEGLDRVQACRERVIAWWEQRLDYAVRTAAMQCPDAPCRERLQQSMEAWEGYRETMSKTAAETAGSYELGITMEQASSEMRYRLTRDQALHIERLAAGQEQPR